MLYVGQWKQNLLLADSFMQDRVLLAGDAVHLVIPTGGLGMNTGVGEATDLAWKLAGMLQGWGGPNLLRSYELERRPVGARNVAASTFASRGRRQWRAAYSPVMRESTPEGARARDDYIRIADREQRKSNEMIGAELGYRYSGSPLVWPEPSEPPEDDFIHYVPSTFPGARCRTSGSTTAPCRIASAAAIRSCASAAATPTCRAARAFAALGAPFTTCGVADSVARPLRLRPVAAAARPARGMARQRAAGGTRTAGPHRHRTLSKAESLTGRGRRVPNLWLPLKPRLQPFQQACRGCATWPAVAFSIDIGRPSDRPG